MTKQKPSDIFEGPDSSLKKAFDEATAPTNDTQLIEEFKLMFPDLWSGELKDTWVRDYVLDFFLSKIHSARKEAQMEVLERIAKSFKDKRVIMWSDDSAQHIRNIQNNETIEKCLAIIQSERSNIK